MRCCGSSRSGVWSDRPGWRRRGSRSSRRLAGLACSLGWCGLLCTGGLWLDLCQRRKDYGLEVGRKDQLLAGLGLGVFTCKALQQGIALNRHTADLQLRQGIHQLHQAGAGPVEAHRHVVALAEDMIDPIGARATRAIFDEDAHAIVIGGMDHATKVHRCGGLVGEGLGDALALGLVPCAAGVGIEAHPGHRQCFAVMDAIPRFTPVLHERAVGDDVMAQREDALAAEALGDAFAACAIACDHTVVVAVDHGEVHPLLAFERRFHLMHRREYPEIAPVDRASHTPGSLGNGKLAGDLPAVHARVDDLLEHGAQIRAAPGPHGQYGIGLARRDAQHRLGLELEPFEAQDAVHLTQKTRAQQHLGWVVRDGLVGRVEPALGIGQGWEARHGLVDQLGQRQHELAAHAGIGRRRSGKYQRQLARDRRMPEIGVAAQAIGGLFCAKRLDEAWALLLVGGSIGGHMHQATGARAALLALGQRGAQASEVGCAIAEDPRGALLAGQGWASGITLAQMHRGALAAQGAHAHIQLAGHGAQPRHGRFAWPTEAHAPVECCDGARHMQQARSGMGMAKQRRDAGQGWIGLVETDGLGHHRHLLPGRDGFLLFLGVGLKALQVLGQLRREALGIHDGQNRPALLAGGLEAHQRQHHRRIARLMALLWQHGPGGGFVHQLAAHVHSAHQRHVQQARPQGTAGDFEGADAGELFCFHRIARALQVEQQANAVGDDVGHGAHGHAGIGHRRKEILQRLEPGLADLQAMAAPGRGPFLGMGPRQVAGSLGIATHADEHTAAGGLDGSEAGGHMARGLQHQQLLGQGLRQILGWVTQPLEGKPHLLDALGCGLAGNQRLQQGAVGFGPAGGHLHGHHGQGGSWQRLDGCGRRTFFPVGLVPRFHDHMRVVAAKAKGVDAGTAWPIGLP